MSMTVKSATTAATASLTTSASAVTPQSTTKRHFAECKPTLTVTNVNCIATDSTALYIGQTNGCIEKMPFASRKIETFHKPVVPPAPPQLSGLSRSLPQTSPVHSIVKMATFGNHVVWGQNDGMVTYSHKNGTLGSCVPFTGEITSVDGKGDFILSADGGTNLDCFHLNVWNIAKHEVVRRLNRYSTSSATFGADEQCVFSIAYLWGSGSTITYYETQSWDLRQKEPKVNLIPREGNDAPWKLFFDGQHLFVGSSNYGFKMKAGVKKYDLRNLSQPVASARLKGAQDFRSVGKFDDLIYTASYGGGLDVWDLNLNHVGNNDTQSRLLSMSFGIDSLYVLATPPSNIASKKAVYTYSFNDNYIPYEAKERVVSTAVTPPVPPPTINVKPSTAAHTTITSTIVMAPPAAQTPPSPIFETPTAASCTTIVTPYVTPINAPHTPPVSPAVTTLKKVQRHFAENGVVMIQGSPALCVASSKEDLYIAGHDGGIRKVAIGPKTDFSRWYSPATSDTVYQQNPGIIGRFYDVSVTPITCMDVFGVHLVHGDGKGSFTVFNRILQTPMMEMRVSGSLNSVLGRDKQVLTANLGGLKGAHLNLWDIGTKTAVFSANTFAPTLQAVFGDVNSIYSITDSPSHMINGWDIRNKSAVTSTFATVPSETPSTLHIEGTNLYVGSSMDGNAKVKLFDVRNQSAPVRDVKYADGSTVTSIKGFGELIYTSGNGFRVWDKSLNELGKNSQVGRVKSMAAGNANTMYVIAEDASVDTLFTLTLKNESSDKKQNK